MRITSLAPQASGSHGTARIRRSSTVGYQGRTARDVQNSAGIAARTGARAGARYTREQCERSAGCVSQHDTTPGVLPSRRALRAVRNRYDTRIIATRRNSKIERGFAMIFES